MLSPDRDDFERGCAQSMEFCERRQSKMILDFTDANLAPPRIRSQPNRWIKGFPTAAVQAKFARALSAFLASAPRREPKCRHKPSIALFIAKPTHELPTVRIPQGASYRSGAKLFGVDSLASPNWGRKTRDFLTAPGDRHGLPGLDTVDQSVFDR
jgi:hypothetical protein